MPILPQIISAQPNPDHFGGARVKAKRRSYTASAGHTSVLGITIEDAAGNPVDLTAIGFAAGESSESLPSRRVAIKERISGDGSFVYANIVTPAVGSITVTLPDCVANTPGIWVMVFSAYLTDNSVRFLGDAYLMVDKGIADECSGSPGIPEIRMFLRDYAQENELLDAVDFDVSEFALAASLCVSEWNEIPPPDGVKYTTSDFPHRWHWLIGIASKLFRIADEHYTRNSLKFASGGKTTDDKNRAQDYRQKADMARQEWSAFIRERKTIDSVNAGGYSSVAGFFSF